MSKHKVANVEDLEGEHSRVIVDIDGVEVAIFRVNGEYYGVANYCIHQGGPLCEGGLSGRFLVDKDGWQWDYDPAEHYIHCPWHGWIFDVRTGKNPDAERYRVPTYEVAVEDGEIFVIR